MRRIPDEYKNSVDDKQYKLNKRLFEACDKDVVDFAEVEELLKEGADPLGATCKKEWYEHIYEQLICDAGIFPAVMDNLPELTKLFLKYGMDISKPVVSYDVMESIHPFWSMPYGASEGMARVLKLLLDNGLDDDSISKFCDQARLDLFYIFRFDPNDEEHNEFCVWTMKMIMLAASYGNILFVCPDRNDYDIKKFREYNSYRYVFNTDKNNIEIFEIETDALVWTIFIEFNIKSK